MNGNENGNENGNGNGNENGNENHSTMTPSDEDPMLGKVIDERYSLEELIGTGGMGRVYRARQKSAGRDVAVKILSEGINPLVVNRLSQEAQIISRLRHPNTIRLFDAGRLPDGRLFLVTELLSGISLRAILKSGPIAAERAMQIGSQVCDALGEAHSMGIIHRDLKPANLMIETVGEREFVKVLDFGIAKLAGDGDPTISDLILGTPTYMSPEQALGSSVDARSDIYSLGIILYCCLAGRPPFGPDSPRAVVYHHIHVAPPRFADLSNPVAVPGPLEDLIWEMLAKSRDLRPADTREVRRRLQLILTHPRGEPSSVGSDVAPTRATSYPYRSESLASSAIIDLRPDAARSADISGLQQQIRALSFGTDEPNPDRDDSNYQMPSVSNAESFLITTGPYFRPSDPVRRGIIVFALFIGSIAFGAIGKSIMWPKISKARPADAADAADAADPVDSPEPIRPDATNDTPVRPSSDEERTTTIEPKAPVLVISGEPIKIERPTTKSRRSKPRKPKRRRAVRRAKHRDKKSTPEDPASAIPQGFVDVFDEE